MRNQLDRVVKVGGHLGEVVEAGLCLTVDVSQVVGNGQNERVHVVEGGFRPICEGDLLCGFVEITSLLEESNVDLARLVLAEKSLCMVEQCHVVKDDGRYLRGLLVR